MANNTDALHSIFIHFELNQIQAGIYIVINSEITEDIGILNEKELLLFQDLQGRRRLSFYMGKFVSKKVLTEMFPEIVPSDIFIDHGIWGQPIIRHDSINNLQITISHSGKTGAALCFPESFPMGLDLEEIKESNCATIKQVLTKSEENLYEDLNMSKTDFLHTLWTSKEALSKSIKLGLGIPVFLLEISSFQQEGILNICYFKHFHQYVSISTTYHKVKLSVVLPSEHKISVQKNLFDKL